MRGLRFRRGGRRRFGRAAAGLLALIAGPDAAGAGDIDALVFGSADAGAATFATVGAKLGLGPLDHDGFAMLASVGGGRRDERGGCACAPRGGYDLALTRYTVNGAVVVGYQWFFRLGRRRGLRRPGGHAGPPHRRTDARRIAVAIRPAPARRSLGAADRRDFGAGDRDRRLGPRQRLGATRLGLPAVGQLSRPEASLYTDYTGYRKWNLGVHATDFSFGRYSFRVSAGAQTETNARRVSPYVALSVWTPW